MWPLKSIAVLLFAHQVLAYNLITYKIPITAEIEKALGYPEDCYLNFTEVATTNGYAAEQHNVTTEDGYILTIFRMRSPNCTTFKSPPVLIIHGVTLNSDEFLNAGPGAGWAYLLADACHDLWLGNHRGNNYARAHTTLNPDKDPEFWDFSLDDYGTYDITAMMDHVLNTTGSAKVNIIGYSLGGLTPLLALASRPEYNSKVGVNVVLAAAASFSNIKSIPLKLIFVLLHLFETPLRNFGIQEVLFKYGVLHTLLEYVCQHEALYEECSFVLSLLDSAHAGSAAVRSVQTLFSSFFSGISVKSSSQLGRNILMNGLYKYDNGAEKNLAVYGTTTSPLYNLSAVVAPTLILHGLNDKVVVPKDVQLLATQLPNVLEVYTVPDPLWNHVDSGWSKNIPTVLYPKVEQYLNATST